MSQQLIATFAFKNADPATVPLKSDQREAFLKCLETKSIWQDEDLNLTFWANLSELKFFTILEYKEPTPQVEGE